MFGNRWSVPGNTSYQFRPLNEFFLPFDKFPGFYPGLALKTIRRERICVVFVLCFIVCCYWLGNDTLESLSAMCLTRYTTTVDIYSYIQIPVVYPFASLGTQHSAKGYRGGSDPPRNRFEFYTARFASVQRLWHQLQPGLRVLYFESNIEFPWMCLFIQK